MIDDLVVLKDGDMDVDGAEGTTEASNQKVSASEVDMEEEDHETPGERAVIAEENTDHVTVNANGLPRDAGVADWDSRKFQTIAMSKYSKDRAVGTSNDTVFAFGIQPPPVSVGLSDQSGTPDTNGVSR